MRALAATRVLESRLYGVATYDALSFIFGAALLMLVALLACLVPALRASRLDPAITIRYE